MAADKIVPSSMSGVFIVITAVISYLVFRPLFKKENHSPKPIPSPRLTQIPSLSGDELAVLPYPPDYFPGKRDVETPYGVMRVFEWGPEYGAKVLFVHGDSTPSPMFGPIARSLVDKGYRVMLFDLWGRGYSDSPIGYKYDAGFLSQQILFALVSSSLSWTGKRSGGFSIIAFSLGGAIAMSFASKFPCLLNSIVLLAPAGLLRQVPSEYESQFFRYSPLVPAFYLRRLVGSLLGVDLNYKSSASARRRSKLSSLRGEGGSSSESRSTPDVGAIIQWQFDEHKGSVHSFIETVRHGPLQHQHEDWKRTCAIVGGKDVTLLANAKDSKLFDTKLLVVFGKEDSIVVGDQVSEDIKGFLDDEHVYFASVPGGHGFPVPSARQVVDLISWFWDYKTFKLPTARRVVPA